LNIEPPPVKGGRMEIIMNILDKFSLKGKSALIVCPEYLYGREIAEGLISAGASVYFAGPDTDKMQSVSKSLEEAGAKVSGCFEYQPGTEAAAKELAAKVKKELPSLDILVENSSGLHLKGWRHTYEEIYGNLQITQLGLMLTVKNLGEIMADQGHGSVLLVSDYAALVGCDPQNYKDCPEYMDEDFSLDYGFVKGSYVNYARQAAGYLGDHGCRCNCIAYGPLAGNRSEAFESAFIRHSHIKRLANAEDVASAAVFLGSDAAEFVTGITMAVDGGYTAK